MAHSCVAGGMGQSSSSPGSYFQGGGLPNPIINSPSPLSSSYGNSYSIYGCGENTLGNVSEDMSNVVFNSVANSGQTVGANSLVMDVNSAFEGGPLLQRRASINAESYMRFPSSLSFPSNNMSISGSSIIADCNAMQPIQHQFQGFSDTSPWQGRSSGHAPLLVDGSSPFFQDSNIAHLQKKPRLEDAVQQQALQQVMQRQNPMQFLDRNLQLHAFLQQQRLSQQQVLRPIQPSHRVQMQQQHIQLKPQVQQQVMQPTSVAFKRPIESGICARRLMQYLYHQRQRPQGSSMAYWRKFAAEYFSPRAKKRWCMSSYGNAVQHGHDVLPLAPMEPWHCDLCGTKSGRGYEATFEVLPRLNEIKFSCGLSDDILFLDMPRECRFPSGLMMVEFSRAVQVCAHEQLRAVCEGHLRIIFSQDLKILSFEFCVQRHEELIPRRILTPHVNHLLQIADKCRSAIASGSEGTSNQDLQAYNGAFASAGRQLSECMETPALNELGFPQRYVTSLKVSDAVNKMKDLIDICQENKVGPIEALRSYLRRNARRDDSSDQEIGRGALGGAAQAASASHPRLPDSEMGSNRSSQYSVVQNRQLPSSGVLPRNGGDASGETENSDENMADCAQKEQLRDGFAGDLFCDNEYDDCMDYLWKK